MKIERTKKMALAVVTMVMVAAGYAQAQSNTRVGIKGGLNISNLYIDDVNDENARTGFHAGLYGQVFSTPAFALQTELLYSTKGSQAQYAGLVNQQVKFNLNYLDLPLLMVFKVGQAAEFHLGGYGSYLVRVNTSYKGDIANGVREMDKDNFKAYDYGLAGGVGVNFGAVQVGARYNYGLVKIAKTDSAKKLLGDAKNSVAQLFIAINLAGPGE